MKEHAVDDLQEPCDHIDCRAARLVRQRVAEFLATDAASQAAIGIIQAANHCGPAVALALVVNAMTVSVHEAVLAEAVAKEAASLDDEWESLDSR